jgi:hypothetical protein
MAKKYKTKYGGCKIPSIDSSIDGFDGEVSGDVAFNNQAYFEDVLETARQAFTYLDSGVWDFRDSLGKSDRELYIDSCKGNLESAISEIESLIETIDQPEKLDKIDSEIMLEHLKKPA